MTIDFFKRTLSNRYIILLINIIISILLFGAIYLVAYVILTIYPITTLGGFFEVIDLLIKIFGIALYGYALIVSAIFIRSKAKKESEKMYGFLFTLLYCIILLILYHAA